MIKNRLLLCSCLSLLLSTQVLSQSEYNASSPNPKNLETRGPPNGKLLIIGGAAANFFYEKFMELAGGPDAPIVVIPTALTSDKLEPADLERFRNSFIRRGFKNVTVLHTRDRKVANSPAFYEPLKSASGVWFSGGRQWRHADSYLDTKTHKAFFELLDRGGVIAGSSAERDSVYQLPDRNYQFYLLDDGDQYDLKNRRVISD